MNQPEISVLLPFYNSAPFLQETISSVLSQSFSNFELILIDDGSTDDSYAIAAAFTDERIRLLKNEKNQGLIFTLNKGLEMARGNLVARMDADDICMPERLALQYQAMLENPDVMVCGGQVNYFGHVEGVSSLPLADADMKAWLLFGPCFVHPTVMFRSSFLRKYQIRYSTRHIHMEDYDLWIRAVTLGKFMNLDQALIRYRMGEQNVTVQNKSTREIRLKAVFADLLTLLEIPATPENLELHFELSHNTTSIRNFKKLKAHIRLLLQQNEKKKVFDPVAMKKLLDGKWKRIFYLAADNGFMPALKYIFAGGHFNATKARYLFSGKLKK